MSSDHEIYGVEFEEEKGYKRSDSGAGAPQGKSSLFSGVSSPESKNKKLVMYFIAAALLIMATISIYVTTGGSARYLGGGADSDVLRQVHPELFTNQ